MIARGFARPSCAVVLLGVAAAFASSRHAPAQPPTTVPPEGLRENTPAVHALVNAKVVLSPGRSVERGTILVRDGVVVAVGAAGDVKPPPEARVWDLTGREVYPGLIDAYSELPEGEGRSPAGGGEGRELLRDTSGGSERRPSAAAGVAGGAAHWNPRVAPQFRADRAYRADPETNRKFRGQGVVARLVAPSRQVIKGTSAAVTTADAEGSRVILRPLVAMHVQLTPAGSPGTERAYPVSPMGAVALVRQAVHDAQWHGKARAAWEANPSLPRPEANDALEAMRPVVDGQLPLVIDAPDELYALRAGQLAKEFNLKHAVVRGSGQEYRRAADVAATGLPLVLPVNFAKAPNVASAESALAYSLEELMDWDLQPENPARLHRAGAKFALTSHGLKDRGEFLRSVRRAVARGLDKDAALRALTTTPADLLGIGRSHGSIEAGKAASFVVADGDLFADTTRVLETWVDGTRYEVVPAPNEDVRGTWAVRLGGEDKPLVTVKLTGEPHKLKGTVTPGAPRPERPAWLWIDDPTRAKSRGGAPPAKLANVGLGASQLTFTFKGHSLGMAGVVQVSATASGDSWLGRGVTADGASFPVTATRVARYGKEEERREREREERERKAKEAGGTGSPDESALTTTVVTAEGQPASPPDEKPAEPVASAPKPAAEPPPGEAERPTTQVQPPPQARAGGQAGAATQPASPSVARQGEKAADKPALFEPNYPLGAFGRGEPPEQPPVVFFLNATVWPCDGRKPFVGSVRVERGKIVSVTGGEIQSLPGVGGIEGAVIVECGGKHLTPGIIDCHSHIATDGGVNEGSQSITCEVRVGDFVNPDDVNVYRQLAGGVTAANVLHGSANTIGGQNQVIKMRWGAGPEAMKFAEAPPGVKFALGENVKRSNSDRAPTRYPGSRMGVEQLVRDAFAAARDYRRAWEGHRTSNGDNGSLPTRVDLELEALCEILDGRRMIHCHSYRQDEILAFLRVCESFGVKVATLQHVLEGYKVADAMAKHGVGGSSFSDWWAYKYEAFDAIPYNGALMHGAGVLVSFNSDDAELARRLNLEAAKAVKYGGVPEEEALKFVTLNPARQLRVDQYVGSIEPGKHADLVLWSGPPLSGLSRCEQTWVDGRRYFDRAADEKTRKENERMRAALVQKILTGGEAMAEETEGEPRPRDVWGYHEDCRAGDCGVRGMMMLRR